MNYICVQLKVTDPSFTEILEAELSELPFESFESEGDRLAAYIQEDQFHPSELDATLGPYADQILEREIETIAHKNWNAVWESNYEPVTFGDELFIRASFHPDPKTTKHSMLLDPNMSFGTGHHPTTALVLGQLFDLDLKDQYVLDFGAGSGVLSIYASMRGSSGIGIEIDAHAAEAARQNLSLNECDSVEIIAGDIHQIPKTNFDIILANINRNVIEESLSTFSDCIKPNGILICSGILVVDIEPLGETIKQHGFKINSTSELDNWGMISAEYIA